MHPKSQVKSVPIVTSRWPIERPLLPTAFLCNSMSAWARVGAPAVPCKIPHDWKRRRTAMTGTVAPAEPTPSPPPPPACSSAEPSWLWPWPWPTPP